MDKVIDKICSYLARTSTKEYVSIPEQLLLFPLLLVLLLASLLYGFYVVVKRRLLRGSN